MQKILDMKTILDMQTILTKSILIRYKVSHKQLVWAESWPLAPASWETFQYAATAPPVAPDSPRGLRPSTCPRVCPPARHLRVPF